jgi:hypothetical protein
MGGGNGRALDGGAPPCAHAPMRHAHLQQPAMTGSGGPLPVCGRLIAHDKNAWHEAGRQVDVRRALRPSSAP